MVLPGVGKQVQGFYLRRLRRQRQQFRVQRRLQYSVCRPCRHQHDTPTYNDNDTQQFLLQHDWQFVYIVNSDSPGRYPHIAAASNEASISRGVP